MLEMLSDPVRQQLILRFRQKPEWGAGEVAATFGLSRPTISHHLNLLERAGLVRSRKDGKEKWYRFNRDEVLERLETLKNLLKNCC